MTAADLADLRLDLFPRDPSPARFRPALRLWLANASAEVPVELPEHPHVIAGRLFEAFGVDEAVALAEADAWCAEFPERAGRLLSCAAPGVAA